MNAPQTLDKLEKKIAELRINDSVRELKLQQLQESLNAYKSQPEKVYAAAMENVYKTSLELHDKSWDRATGFVGIVLGVIAVISIIGIIKGVREWMTNRLRKEIKEEMKKKITEDYNKIKQELKTDIDEAFKKIEKSEKNVEEIKIDTEKAFKQIEKDLDIAFNRFRIDFMERNLSTISKNVKEVAKIHFMNNTFRMFMELKENNPALKFEPKFDVNFDDYVAKGNLVEGINLYINYFNELNGYTDGRKIYISDLLDKLKFIVGELIDVMKMDPSNLISYKNTPFAQAFDQILTLEVKDYSNENTIARLEEITQMNNLLEEIKAMIRGADHVRPDNNGENNGKP